MSRIVVPLDDRVLVRPSDPTKVTKGGIHLPDNAREKPSEGVVVRVGPGKRLENGDRAPLALSEGDEVIYSKYAGTTVRVGEVDHVLLRESDCVAKIEEEAAVGA